MGVVAGINPRYAIAGAFGLAFVMMVLVDLTFGLCAFTFLSFLELLLVSEDSSFSFLKVAGFLLLCPGWRRSRPRARRTRASSQRIRSSRSC